MTNISTRGAIAIAVLVECVAAAPAMAADGWVEVARARDNTLYELRTTGQRRTGSLWYVWYRITPAKPTPVYKAKPNGDQWTDAKVQFALDCAQRRYATLARYEYNVKGDLVWEHTYPSLDFETPPPESVAERMVDTTCDMLEPTGGPAGR